MTHGATAYRRALAVAGFFTLLAGDFWRNLLSWWGWGAVVVVLLVLSIIELIRARVHLRRLPPLLLMTLAVFALSIVWSQYRVETALGVILTLATTVFAVFLATCLSLREFIDAAATATKLVLAASLAFEIVVALVIRRPVLPFWVDWSHLDTIPKAFFWSRNVLLEGDRIQGIVGNANLLAFAALIGLVAFAAQWADDRSNRVAPGIWAAVAILVLALTRSTTVLVAAAFAAVVGAAVAVARRTGRHRLVGLAGAALALSAALAAVLFREPLLRLVGRSSDLTNRLDIWERVVDLIAAHPFLGWGWVSYWPPWVSPFDDLALIRGVRYLQAHNAWLDLALQVGVLGALVVAGYVATSIVGGWRMATRPGPWSAAVPIVVLGILLVHSLAESRLLIEGGWAMLVASSIIVSRRRPEVDA